MKWEKIQIPTTKQKQKQTTKDFHNNKQQNRNLYSKNLHKKSHKYPQIPNAQTEDANWARHTLWFQTEDAEREGDRGREQQSEGETESKRETKNESESETEREIENMWESLLARLRKSEWVDNKIERVRGWLRKWVMRE